MVLNHIDFALKVDVGHISGCYTWEGSATCGVPEFLLNIVYGTVPHSKELSGLKCQWCQD